MRLARASAGHQIADRYARVLERALLRPALVLAAAAVAVAAGLFLGSKLPTDFLPEADEGGYVVDYFAPVGASLAAIRAGTCRSRLTSWSSASTRTNLPATRAGRP